MYRSTPIDPPRIQLPQGDSARCWPCPCSGRRLDTGGPAGGFGGTPEIRTIAFHPTKPWVYVHDKGQVTGHRFDVVELATIARSTVTRCMTTDECSRYLGRPCP
jgi:hypothetical protein